MTVVAITLAVAVLAALALAAAALSAAVSAGRREVAAVEKVGQAEAKRMEAEGLTLAANISVQSMGAALDTSERLRLAQKKRGNALEDLVHDLQSKPSPPGTSAAAARNSMLQALRDINDAASGEGDRPAADGGGAGALPHGAAGPTE